MRLICVIVIMSAGGYREAVEMEGIWVKDSGDYYMVDFEKEFLKRKVDLKLQTMVQRVQDNACLFKDGPPKHPF